MFGPSPLHWKLLELLARCSRSLHGGFDRTLGCQEAGTRDERVTSSATLVQTKGWNHVDLFGPRVQALPNTSSVRVLHRERSLHHVAQEGVDGSVLLQARRVPESLLGTPCTHQQAQLPLNDDGILICLSLRRQRQLEESGFCILES